MSNETSGNSSATPTISQSPGAWGEVGVVNQRAWLMQRKTTHISACAADPFRRPSLHAAALASRIVECRSDPVRSHRPPPSTRSIDNDDCCENANLDDGRLHDVVDARQCEATIAATAVETCAATAQRWPRLRCTAWRSSASVGDQAGRWADAPGVAETDDGEGNHADNDEPAEEAVRAGHRAAPVVRRRRHSTRLPTERIHLQLNATCTATRNMTMSAVVVCRPFQKPSAGG